jgi:hypothetical protein
VEFVRCPAQDNPTFSIFGFSDEQKWTLLDGTNITLYNVTLNMGGYTAANYNNSESSNSARSLQTRIQNVSSTNSTNSTNDLGYDLYFEGMFVGSGVVFPDLDPDLYSEVTINYQTMDNAQLSAGIQEVTAVYNYTGTLDNPVTFSGMVELHPCYNPFNGYEIYTGG